MDNARARGRSAQRQLLISSDRDLAHLLTRLYQHINAGGPLGLATIDRLTLIMQDTRHQLEALVKRNVDAAGRASVELGIELATPYASLGASLRWDIVRMEVLAAASTRLASDAFSHSLKAFEVSGQAKIASEILEGLKLREGPHKIARRIAQYVLPGRGAKPFQGVANAALTLARTEMAVAFNRAALDCGAKMVDAGIAYGSRWHLSGKHKQPDVCNKNADYQYPPLLDKLQAAGIDPKGVWPPADPVSPVIGHAKCLCYFTTVLIPLTQFIKQQGENK